MICCFKIPPCGRAFVIGLLLALAGIAHTPVVHAQSEDIHEVLRSVLGSFNELSANFSEMYFRYDDLEDERIRGWRAMTCIELQEIIDDRNTFTEALRVVSEEIIETVETNNSQAFGQLRGIAQEGDAFTEFINEEKAILTEFDLSQNSWEIILQQAVGWRSSIVHATDQQIENTVSSFSSDFFVDGVISLCDDNYSPEHNESTAGWKSWLWYGIEFIGGTTVFLGNLLADPEPTTKAMSMFFGGMVASNGYSGLSTLFRNNR